MQEQSSGSSTGIIVAVMVVIIIIIISIIIIAVIFITILRSKQKKKDVYASVPNSKGGGNTLGEVEMSGKATEQDGMYDVVNNIDNNGGKIESETGMDASKSRYDKTGETYLTVNDAGWTDSAVGAGESDQLYNRLRANEKKQQNFADHTYSKLHNEEELAFYSTVSQPGSVTETANPVYSDPDSNHEQRHTSTSDVYAQVNKPKEKPKGPKPNKKQEVLEEYAVIGTTGAPEIPKNQRVF